MTLSSPSSLAIFATTSVRHVSTLSVIPSDSIINMSAPASRKRRPWAMAHAGSRVPSASSSAVALAAPAPKPLETSMMSNPRSWHSPT
jgi:hypothetical protein